MSQNMITVVGSFAVGMTIRTGRMPVFGETLIGTDFDMGPGGKGSNQAVAMARLGANAAFVGMIGADKLGDIAADLYRVEGVDTRYLERTCARATGVGFIIVNHAGHNGIILDMSANQLMDAAFVDRAEDQIARSRIVMSVLEIPVEAAGRAMALGRKHGATTILNPAPATRLDDSIIQQADYLTPNEIELRILLGLAPDDPTPTLELAQHLRKRGARTLIVTMGEQGALVLSDDGTLHVPGIPVDVVDTTGAGDAFNAGLAVALSEGRALRQAVQYATCTGALACTRLGVIPSLATRAAADALYAQHYPA